MIVKLLLTTGVILVGLATTLGLSHARHISGGSFKPSNVTLPDTGTTGTETTPKLEDSVKKVKLEELDLSADREVYIYGVIDESSAPPVAQRILELGKDSRPINILINSPGGSVLDGATIISAMQAAKGPVNTVCVQICASMAAMIHSYGTKRLMIDRSLVMFHPATGGAEGEVDKMYSRLTTLKEFIGELELNAATRAGMSYQDYKFHSGVEMWIEARRALSTHFADGIVYVRGPEASKLFVNVQGTMKYINKRLPFTMYPGQGYGKNGRFYWISPEAFVMMYGKAALSNYGR
jgi:ATP-dependent Clp protease, protease subunit